jgi:shikimate kinase
MDNLYLVGMRCTGKTTLAKALARKLGRVCIDMDDEIRSMAGKTVAEIVSEEGWEGFRKREQEVAQILSEQKNLVVGTGGGALMFFDNAERFQQSGKIILLTADIKVLFERLKRGKDRPALTDTNGLGEMQQLWEERKESYHKWADVIVDTSDWDEEMLLDQISKSLEE